MCAEKCLCSSKLSDPDEIMETILGVGDVHYQKVKEFYQTFVGSDESDSGGEEIEC